ncbi:unnamed protein product [Prorocentrum cordatum]|uniref:Calpain catalytic domain-containing protein n=1 Tax=Prorocentrum cordatum TaxID=2364126 RepID=A0ABN9VM71_9DINO|nr:unnamed protein product [Polarella glacialis]
MCALAEFSGAVKKVFAQTPGIDSMPGEGENKYVVTRVRPEDLEAGRHRGRRAAPREPKRQRPAGLRPERVWGPVGTLHREGVRHPLRRMGQDQWRPVHARLAHAHGLQRSVHLHAGRQRQCTAASGPLNPNTHEWEELANSPHDGFRGLWPHPWPEVGGGGGLMHKIDSDEMFERMCAFDDENYIMGAGTKAGSDTQDTDGIVDGRAYTIMDCVNNAGGTEFDLIKVRNPWGQGEFKSGMWDDDGPGWTQYPQVKEALKPVAADERVFSWLTKRSSSNTSRPSTCARRT